MKTTNLSKCYGKAMVVDHVSLEIKQGDIFGFIGENGAGKTTYMRMLCGLVRPSGGEIELFQETSPKKLNEMRRKIGSLIEVPAIYPDISAFYNLKIQGNYLGLDITSKKLSELLDLVGLSDVGKKAAGKFSMGMKQRLGIALALLGEPEVLILDEPTVGMDPVGVKELRDLLLSLQKEQHMTIFFSSHDLTEMCRIATRFGIMHKGKLIKQITPEELDRECSQKNISQSDYFVELIAAAE